MMHFPPGVALPEPERFIIRHGGCLQRSISTVLWVEGYQPQLLLGKFWHFFREWGPPFRHKDEIMSGAFHMYATWFDNSRDALRQHGIRVVYCQGMGFEPSWQIIWERLRRGLPTPVLVDLYYVPLVEQFYQRQSLTHVSPVVGCDVPAGRIYLLNTSKNTIAPVEVEFSVFQQAWGTEAYEWYDVILPEVLGPFSTDDVQRAVLANADLMLRPHPGEAWGQGIPAMRSLADDIARLPERYDAKALVDIRADSFAQIPNVREQRFIHANFLHLVAEQIGHARLLDFAEHLYSIGKAWQEFRQWFVRVEEMEPQQGFATIADRLREVATLEEQAMTQLEEIVTAGDWPRNAVLDLRAPRKELSPLVG